MCYDIFFKIMIPFLFVVSVECRTCQTMDIRNNLQSLNKLRNCTEIVGNLKILLIERVKSEQQYDDYVFPELTEITGYLFFFKVAHLTSIAKLFPNLRVIRGHELFTDYSLVMYNMPHLREIGTKDLMFIARGFVKVDKCPQLCFADTVDWQRIGTKLDFTNTNNGTCEACPRHCGDLCWNMQNCQEIGTENCHEECLGCYKENSPKHCRVCKNYDDHGTCVPECRNNTHNLYKHSYSYKCVTENECRTTLNGTWWIFKKECVNECPLKYEIVGVGLTTNCKYCGNSCTKWCETERIDSINKLQKLRGCTHINGSLVIHMAGVKMKTEHTIVQEMEEYLGSVKYIRDSLVVTWTKAIRSLSFLKNLSEIRGQELTDRTHAVLFRENQNLQKLWDFDSKDFSLKIGNGLLGFHYNPLLCTSEIKRLANLTGITTNLSTLDIYGNGDKTTCNFVNLTVAVNASVDKANLTWEIDTLPDNDAYIGFTIYYIERAQGEISTYESTDVCDGTGWKSQFTTNNSIVLSSLLPFMRYAYYIKIYRSSMEGAQSNVSYFKTLPDDPEVPSYFDVSPTNYDTITLSWLPPRAINGIPAHYKLYVVMESDLRVHMERDYCQNPRTEGGEKIDEEDDMDRLLTPQTPNRTVSLNNCTCPYMKEYEKEEIGFLTFDNHLPLCDVKAQSKFGFDKCKHLLYEPVVALEKQIYSRAERNIKSSQATGKTVRSPTVSGPILVNISANYSDFYLTGLRHFSLYVFYFSACNKGHKCGPVVQSFTRTLKREDADNVDSIEATVEDSSVIIEWSEPKDPNSMIVSYNIEYNKIDSEHSKPSTECLARNKRFVTNKLSLTNLLPGKYTARVQAVSLAGPGQFSKYAIFVIEAPARVSTWVIIVIITSLVILIAAFLVYLRYKRKLKLEHIHLIASINPDYDGVVYVEDEWEIERNDIDLLNDLGHGTFGVVYCGLIKSRNMSCAIKTVNESVSLHERMEFLNEASVMKSFSNSHHVVKLLGVVSRGQPPLVVMELMERGDLKKYLRRMRDSSQNITANEIYRMSIEIADGMSYLSAKKFVHRDLAARNCMVAHDRTVKIGDFGMARDIYETDYYRKETKGLLPVRWMAPESLADGIFTSDSDIWSYGIVLWEIATLAEQPYQGLSNEQVLQFVVSKGRLERPPECPDLLYEIMDACWCWRPNDRPTFSDVVERLEDHVGQDFKLVSFIHSREGLEHKMTHGRERAYNPPALGMGAQEHDLYGGHYNASDEEVSLYVGESSRPRFLPSSLSQRHSRFSPSDLY